MGYSLNQKTHKKIKKMPIISNQTIDGILASSFWLTAVNKYSMAVIKYKPTESSKQAVTTFAILEGNS